MLCAFKSCWPNLNPCLPNMSNWSYIHPIAGHTYILACRLIIRTKILRMANTDKGQQLLRIHIACRCCSPNTAGLTSYFRCCRIVETFTYELWDIRVCSSAFSAVAEALNMHGVSNPRSLPSICSTCASTCRGRARASVSRICAAKDVMCKDVVNIRKRSAASMEGQATIVFAGVEGQEIEVQCPKVFQCSRFLLAFPDVCNMWLSLVGVWFVGYLHFRCWCRSRFRAAFHMQGWDLWV